MTEEIILKELSKHLFGIEALTYCKEKKLVIIYQNKISYQGIWYGDEERAKIVVKQYFLSDLWLYRERQEYENTIKWIKISNIK
jgi:hypothetical protein